MVHGLKSTPVRITLIFITTILISVIGSLYGWVLNQFSIDTAFFITFEALSTIAVVFLAIVTASWIASRLLFDQRCIPSWSTCVIHLIGPFIFAAIATFIAGIIATQYETYMAGSHSIVLLILWGIVALMVILFLFAITGLVFPLVILGVTRGAWAGLSMSFKFLRKQPIRTLSASIFVLAIVEIMTLVSNLLPKDISNFGVTDSAVIIIGPLWILAAYWLWKGDFRLKYVGNKRSNED